MPYPVIPDIPGTTQSDPVVSTQKANVLAANTPPTLALDGEVVGITPANTGLPVNVPVILQKANAASTGSVATLAKAFTNNNVAGNSIVVVCGCGNGTAMTVADSAGNTYTQAVNAPNSTTFEAAIFYAVGIVGGANTVTVTNAGSAASMAMEIYEVSGLLAQVTAQPDASSSGTGTGTTASTSALAASSPNSLAFLGVSIGTAAQNITVTSGTNWTADGGTNGLATTTPAGLYQFNSFSQYLGNTTPVVPKATVGSSEPWAAAAAVFKPVSLGVAGTVQIGGWNYTRIASATTTLVKTGPGVLHSVVLGTLVASSSIELDDALTHTSPVISTITPPATVTSVVPFTVLYDVVFSTGLSVTTVGASPDYTIVWR